MRYLLTLTLLGLAIAGCSPAPQSTTLSTLTPVAAYVDIATEKAAPNDMGATNEAGTGNVAIASVATEGIATEDVATEAAPGSTTIVITANPTPILLVPIQGNTIAPALTPQPLSHEGWRTFLSADLQVAIDYPSDWSLAEQADGATFTSPQGPTILLQVVKVSADSNEIRIGNQRCTSRTNAYNLTANICVDTASFSYSAKFALKSVDGSARWLTLTTTARKTGDVFEAMFDSVRPAN